jgi:hypothetical protein
MDRTPLEQLIGHWMNERHAPDILPAQETLLAHLLDHLRRQVCFGFLFIYLFLLRKSHIGAKKKTVRSRPAPARRPLQLRRGAAHAHHARADRDRARQVHRPVLRPHTPLQGTAPTSLSLTLTFANRIWGERRSNDTPGSSRPARKHRPG